MRFLLVLFCWVVLSVYAQEVLTNQSIVDMVELGLEDEIILSKLNEAPLAFDTSIEELKKLKAKKVSAHLISMMIKKSDEKKIIPTGIFLKTEVGMVKVLPTVFSGTKTSTAAAAFSYGIADAKVISLIPNATSKNVIKENIPEFHFIFDGKKVDNLSPQGHGLDWWFKTATSPNEFVLVEMKSSKRKNQREIQVGKGNIYAGTQSGINSKQAIAFVIEQMENNTFKVVPEQPLKEGEYGFFYQGTIPHGGNNQSVFDFSIVAN